MKVLVVDDNPGFRDFLGSLLTAAAHEVVVCPDGQFALDEFRKHRPDCVLMDVAMPGVDGLEAARRIKAAFPASRIIMVTDYNDHELRLAAQKAGAEGFVLKENLSVLKSLNVPL